MSYKLRILLSKKQVGPLRRLLRALEEVVLTGLDPENDNYPYQVAEAAIKAAEDKQTAETLRCMLAEENTEFFSLNDIEVRSGIIPQPPGWTGAPETWDEDEFIAEGDYSNYDLLAKLAQHILGTGSPEHHAVLNEWDGDDHASASMAVITRDDITWYDLADNLALHSSAMREAPWALKSEPAADRFLDAAASSQDELESLRAMVRGLATAAGVCGRMKAIKNPAIQSLLDPEDPPAPSP